jgi:hypothetical protein
MSIGPLNAVNAGAAGVPLSQAKGSEIERTAEQLGAERRRVYHGRKAEAAAGVGQPDGEDHEAADRQPDGRYPWDELSDPVNAEPTAPTSANPTQELGNLLDLSG